MTEKLSKDSASESKKTRSSASRRAPQKTGLPSVDQILTKLIELNSAVAIGAISSKDANLIQKNFKIILDVQLKRAKREDSGPSQEALSELCRDDPRILNALEPFLTDNQVECLMDEITDDPDDQV